MTGLSSSSYYSLLFKAKKLWKIINKFPYIKFPSNDSTQHDVDGKCRMMELYEKFVGNLHFKLRGEGKEDEKGAFNLDIHFMG
jgi:hypothetical protein